LECGNGFAFERGFFAALFVAGLAEIEAFDLRVVVLVAIFNTT
jgi:hypothetical protein